MNSFGRSLIELLLPLDESSLMSDQLMTSHRPEKCPNLSRTQVLETVSNRFLDFAVFCKYRMDGVP
jgi:hypothetical protein